MPDDWPIRAGNADCLACNGTSHSMKRLISHFRVNGCHWLIAFILAFWMLVQPSWAAISERPNFLVIFCDDLGYGDLQCYGHPKIKTPHLNQLANEGIRFTSCYSASPVCSPSRAGLLTGRTPSRTGVYDWIPEGHTVHLPKSEVTIATTLQKAGYQTAHVGKWHLNGKFNSDEQPQPRDHGFDYWFSTQNNASPSHENPKNFVRNGKPVGKLNGYSCQLVASDAMQWLEDRDKSAPFFLHVCFHEPHEPVASPKKLVDRYLPESLNQDEAQYFANVTNLDDAVGKIVKKLQELELDGNTLVFFTSDNGPETLNRYRRANRSYGSPGELRGMKLWMYEGGIRVAGILRWAGQVAEKQVLDTPICSIDLLPTFCELAGASVPEDRTLDGTSLTPILEGGTLLRSKPLYWHYYRAYGQHKVALRSGEWVLLANREQPALRRSANVNTHVMQVIKETTLNNFKLYNLSEDVTQQDELGDRYPKIFQPLREELIRRHQEVQAEGPEWEFAQ